MIDYCIGFYERRRECEDLEQKADTQEDDVAREEDDVARKEDDVAKKLSMRQIFSNHINYVVSTYPEVAILELIGFRHERRRSFSKSFERK